jgi:hypothetical protein
MTVADDVVAADERRVGTGRAEVTTRGVADAPATRVQRIVGVAPGVTTQRRVTDTPMRSDAVDESAAKVPTAHAARARARA